jgi:hypothetical protein
MVTIIVMLIFLVRFPFDTLPSDRLMALATILLPLFSTQRGAVAMLSYSVTSRALTSINSDSKFEETVFPLLRSLTSTIPDGSNVVVIFRLQLMCGRFSRCAYIF